MYICGSSCGTAGRCFSQGFSPLLPVWTRNNPTLFSSPARGGLLPTPKAPPADRCCCCRRLQCYWMAAFGSWKTARRGLGCAAPRTPPEIRRSTHAMVQQKGGKAVYYLDSVLLEISNPKCIDTFPVKTAGGSASTCSSRTQRNQGRSLEHGFDKDGRGRKHICFLPLAHARTTTTVGDSLRLTRPRL